MAINKEFDEKGMQGVQGKLRRKFASGVEGKSVPRLFLSNLDLPSFEAVMFGGVGFLMGGLIAGMTYDLSERHELEAIQYGLSENANSYQGFNNEYILQRTEAGDYALYEVDYGDDTEYNGEVDYTVRAGDAIGALYNIRHDLETIRDKIMAGEPLDERETSYMFSVEHITTLHEEQSGTIERETGDIILDVMGNQDFLNKINYILPIIDSALEDIYENGEYGLPQSDIDNRDSNLSEGQAIGRGFATSGILYALLLLGSSLNGARADTRRQMRRSREKKSPRP
jgi:hypothetical protein